MVQNICENMRCIRVKQNSQIVFRNDYYQEKKKHWKLLGKTYRLFVWRTMLQGSQIFCPPNLTNIWKI
jgi:hypothetical protein